MAQQGKAIFSRTNPMTTLTAPHSYLESALRDRGFKSRDRKRFDDENAKPSRKHQRDNPKRFTYKRGSWRVLTDSQDCPWWTVQRVAGDEVQWFVDFPVGVNLEAMMLFIEFHDA
jgi:hypothetical protein